MAITETALRMAAMSPSRTFTLPSTRSRYTAAVPGTEHRSAGWRDGEEVGWEW